MFKESGTRKKHKIFLGFVIYPDWTSLVWEGAKARFSAHRKMQSAWPTSSDGLSASLQPL